MEGEDSIQGHLVFNVTVFTGVLHSCARSLSQRDQAIRVYAFVLVRGPCDITCVPLELAGKALSFLVVAMVKQQFNTLSGNAL